MRLLIIAILFISCSRPELKEGQLHIAGNDTFQVHLDTQYVNSSELIFPRNVTEEASPKFRITTNKDTFESHTSYKPNTPFVVAVIKKISQ